MQKRLKRNHNKLIFKANGNREYFSTRKLARSLERTGLKKSICNSIAHKVSQEVREGDQTKTIYRRALNLVKQKSPLATVNYSLKKALFDLGPEGHHFEEYVARYFSRKGYQTETCKILQGKFVRHEVDCIGQKRNEKFYAECKFHNRAGTKNDVKISLYVKARWDDLKEGPEGKDLSAFYIVSNTAFTTDAVTYANGTGLKLLGVNSPSEHSFLEEIKELKLYPITSLRSIGKQFKKILISKGIILAEDIVQNQTLLYKTGLTTIQVKNALDELNLLMKAST